jgi:polyketide biosynthesis 3-hydroxy-3-methylglutaryl-CoA synthase-like enzyme PksG
MLEAAEISQPCRIGLFSYGSGCCSEFFSGTVTPDSQRRLRGLGLAASLDRRYRLSMDEYELLLKGEHVVRFGTRDTRLDQRVIPAARDSFTGSNRLVLDEVAAYHRVYSWA